MSKVAHISGAKGMAHMLRIGTSQAHSINIPTNILGYLVRGCATFHGTDGSMHVGWHELYLLQRGNYVVEWHAPEGAPHEEVLLTLSDELMCRIVNNDHFTPPSHLWSTPNSGTPATMVSQSATATDHTLFRCIGEYLRMGLFGHDGILENLKVHEVIFLLFTAPQSPIGTQLRTMAWVAAQGNFERCVTTNLFRNIPLEELAKECNMSLSGFKSHFRKVYGESPHRWFTTQRLNAAQHLLRYTDNQIKRIAYECGFATPSVMIRLFRKRFGTTPAHYRALHRLPTSPEEGEGGENGCKKPSAKKK